MSVLFCNIYFILVAKKWQNILLGFNSCLGNNVNDIYISLFTGTVPWKETASHLPLSATISVHQICWQQISLYQRFQKYRLLKAQFRDREKTEDCELGEMSTWQKKIINCKCHGLCCFVCHVNALYTIHLSFFQNSCGNPWVVQKYNVIQCFVYTGI